MKTVRVWRCLQARDIAVSGWALEREVCVGMNPPFAEREELPTLEAEYSKVRDDSRNFWVLVSALFSVPIAIVGGLAALSSDACPIPRAKDSCAPGSPWLWFLAPLAPITLTILVIQQIVLATARSTYERALERRIVDLRRVRVNPPPPLTQTEHGAVLVPSYSRISNAFFDVGRAPGPFRLLVLLLNIVGAALLLGSIVMSISELPSQTWRVISGGTYAVVLVAIAWAMKESLDGPAVWKSVIRQDADDTPQLEPPDRPVPKR